GNPIPNFLNGGPYLNLDQQSTNTNEHGGAVQMTNRSPLFDRSNQLVVGLSFDGAQTLFGASTQVGGLSVWGSMFAGPGITEPRRRCRGQHPDPTRRPAARHPGQSVQARRRLQGNRRVDCRRRRDRRQRPVPVRRRGQFIVEDTALYRAQPAYELSGNK